MEIFIARTGPGSKWFPKLRTNSNQSVRRILLCNSLSLCWKTCPYLSSNLAKVIGPVRVRTRVRYHDSIHVGVRVQRSKTSPLNKNISFKQKYGQQGSRDGSRTTSASVRFFRNFACPPSEFVLELTNACPPSESVQELTNLVPLSFVSEDFKAFCPLWNHFSASVARVRPWGGLRSVSAVRIHPQ